MSVKSSKGFYQGLIKRPIVKLPEGCVDSGIYHPEFAAEMCLEYGHTYLGPTPKVSYDKGKKHIQVASEVVQAWIDVCNMAKRLKTFLDAQRPKPVITAVGLSPKVTATLKECELDIDLPTITPAKIITIYGNMLDKNGNVVLDWEGVPVRIPVDYRIEWSAGIQHSMSRFAYSGGCHACGKNIPSGRFVPVEAKCKNKGLISMWLGCDCAKNIFGIKDVGVPQK